MFNNVEKRVLVCLFVTQEEWQGMERWWQGFWFVTQISNFKIIKKICGIYQAKQRFANNQRSFQKFPKISVKFCPKFLFWLCFSKFCLTRNITLSITPHIPLANFPKP